MSKAIAIDELPTIEWGTQTSLLQSAGGFFRSLLSFKTYMKLLSSQTLSILFSPVFLFLPYVLNPSLGFGALIIGYVLWAFALIVPQFLTFLARQKYDIIQFMLLDPSGTPMDQEFHFHTITKRKLFTAAELKGNYYNPGRYEKIEINETRLTELITETEEELEEIKENQEEELAELGKIFSWKFSLFTLVLGELLVGMVGFLGIFLLTWFDVIRSDRDLAFFSIFLLIGSVVFLVLWRKGDIDLIILRMVDKRLAPPSIQYTVSQLSRETSLQKTSILKNQLAGMQTLKNSINSEGKIKTNLLLLELGQKHEVYDAQGDKAADITHLYLLVPAFASALEQICLIIQNAEIAFPDGAYGRKDCYLLGAIQMVTQIQGVPVCVLVYSPFGLVTYADNPVTLAQSLQEKLEGSVLGYTYQRIAELMEQAKKAREGEREATKAKLAASVNHINRILRLRQRFEGKSFWGWLALGVFVGGFVMYFLLVGVWKYEPPSDAALLL